MTSSTTVVAPPPPKTLPQGQLSVSHLLSIGELTRADLELIFSTARSLKHWRDSGEHNQLLAGKRLAMIFEKDSLRTRFTFDIGMQDLGGSAVFMDHRDARIGSRESLVDVAKNLSRWVHGIVARTYRQRAVEELAKHADAPVINGLTDALHPCQALTDLFTLQEHVGDLQGRRLAFLGDGNNTCHSLIHACAQLGVHMTIATPKGFEPNAEVITRARQLAAEANNDATITTTNDRDVALQGADAVYTDTWVSMGQEDEAEDRHGLFADFQVTNASFEHTDPNAVFMHCLPAHRGAEVTAAVMDGERSIVYDIAENRLHVQKALLALLLR